jgi:hypothetical protein
MPGYTGSSGRCRSASASGPSMGTPFPKQQFYGTRCRKPFHCACLLLLLKMLIDASIRDWVLFPLLLLVILVHFVRMYLLKITAAEATVNVVEMEQK